MDKYAITGVNTVTASPGDTVVAVEAVGTTRAKLYEVMFGTLGTPADNVLQWLLRRFSAVGTRTGVTPTALDPAAPAALLAGAEDHTVEPTYTAGTELLDLGVNQRASWRWVAAPESELVIPASAGAGIGLAPISSGYSGDANGVLHYVE